MKIFSFNKKSDLDKEKRLSNFIYEYISKSKILSSQYKRSFRNIARHITGFSDYTGIEINTDSFTEQLAEEFIIYLKRKNLMLSTVRDILQRIGIMLRRANKSGYKVNFGFESVTIKIEESCSIYLTHEELNRLNELKNLSKEARAVRDRFLVGCYTAMRISDYRRIDETNVIGNTIQIKTQKTGALVVIPIHPVVQEIFERNSGTLPGIPSQQAFGNTIKRVCKKAGINSPVRWERTIGNKIVKKIVPKYTLISSHTARRTGATLMYLSGIPTARIMLLTGHKTEQSFFKYIRIGKEENAKELSDHPFFK